MQPLIKITPPPPPQTRKGKGVDGSPYKLTGYILERAATLVLGHMILGMGESWGVGIYIQK
jgi:hypothetical protein